MTTSNMSDDSTFAFESFILGLPSEIKVWIENYKRNRQFNKSWTRRNLTNVNMLLDALEEKYWDFDREIFMVRTTELELKLRRIGFEPIVKEQLNIIHDNFWPFALTLQHPIHNVVVRLIEQNKVEPLEQALAIADEVSAYSGGISIFNCFVASLIVLSNEKNV